PSRANAVVEIDRRRIRPLSIDINTAGHTVAGGAAEIRFANVPPQRPRGARLNFVGAPPPNTPVHRPVVIAVRMNVLPAKFGPRRSAGGLQIPLPTGPELAGPVPRAKALSPGELNEVRGRIV